MSRNCRTRGYSHTGAADTPFYEAGTGGMVTRNNLKIKCIFLQSGALLGFFFGRKTEPVL